MSKRLICWAWFVLVVGLALASSAAAADPNLVGWWPLNDGTGDTVVDLSGNGNDGTINNPANGLGADGSVWIEDAEMGTVVSFDGTAAGAYIRAGSIPQMTLENDFTWAFWAKQAPGNGSNDIILGNRMDENAVDFVPRQFIKFTPTKFEWHMNGNGDDNMDYEDIPDDVWLHHAVVKTGDQLTYYRNGVAASSGTITQALDVPQPLFFGGDNENAAGENWAGSMSDVRTYNRALADLEVQIIAQSVLLFAEDFEGLALGPNVDEGLAGDAVWTDVPPDGWVVDESGIPGIGDPTTDGVTEWAGWAFADKAWWIQAAEDQDRSLFTLGSGTVAVADPDEWDDADRIADPIADNPYDTWLTTPAIDISGLVAETVELTFASSWRPEFDDNYHQTASVTASFDGGEPVMVMLWESDSASENYKPYATNEIVTVSVPNPAGATSVVLEFGLSDAGNDWWWAIDNIEVSGVPLPEPVDPGTEGLAAYYPLDGDASDASGNGLDGTVMGDPVWVDGILDGAMECDGEGDYVDVAHADGVDITGAISLSLWIRPDAEDPEGQGLETAPMCKALSGASPSWSWQVRYGWGSPQPYMAFTFNTSPRAWAYVGQNLVQGEWCHIACSADGETLTAYLNGMATESTAMGAITSSPTPVLIGSDGWGSDWLGALDDVAIYNRGLSGAEIRYLAGFRAEVEEEAPLEEAPAEM